MISYSYASVYSAKPEEYVLKIHGQDVHDVFIQLGDFYNNGIMASMLKSRHNETTARHVQKI